MRLNYSKLAWIAIVPLLVAMPVLGAQQDPNKPPRPAVHKQFQGQTGTASYYGPAHQGKRTASGRRFDQKELTAAHPWLPFGTKIRVTAQGTGKSVVVVITDRLHSKTRVVDLSLAAAKQLGMVRQGIARVSLAPV